MFRKLAAAILGSASLIAGHAAAQTPPKPVSPPVITPSIQVMETWLAQSAAWSQSHIALTQEAVVVVGQTMAAARQAADGFDDVEAATAWAARQRAVLDGISARFARISPTPPLLPMNISEADRVEGESVRDIGQMGYESSRAILATLATKLDPIFVTILSATRGDTGARDRVKRDAIELSILLIELENAMLASSLLPKGHPQRDVQAASIESNRAILAMLVYQRDVAADRPSAPRSAADSMRRYAQLTRDAADTLAVDVETWRTSLAGGTGDVSFDARLGQIIALYVASVDVERRLADALDVVADRVEAGDFAGIDAAYPAVAQLIQQRLSLDTSRRQAISAQ